MIKNKLKIILIIIISIIVVSSISVYATYNYLASEIEYEKEDGTKVSVETALNELYNGIQNASMTTILDDNRAEYEIPNGVNEIYVFVSRGTTNIPYTITISGTEIVKNEIISNTSRVDVNMAVYIDIYKITLTGNSGKIQLSRSGGNAASQAWNSCVIY